jgi:PAS domain S-box-containing protein
MNPDIDRLVAVVDELDPHILTAKDVTDLKTWAADRAGFVVVDIEDQSILYATEGAEKIFGYVTDEMVGKPLLDLVPDEFKRVHEGHVEGFGKAMQQRAMGRRDKLLYGKERDGEIFPVEISLYPRTFKGRSICIANVVRLSKEI